MAILNTIFLVSLTDDQAKALLTIRDCQIRSAGEFVSIMWPNKNDWLKLSMPDRHDAEPDSYVWASIYAGIILGNLIRDGYLKPFEGGFRSCLE